MEYRLTNEELIFLAKFTGAQGVLGVSVPELDNPSHFEKRLKKIGKELYDKDLVLSSKKGYIVGDPMKTFINTICYGDISWIVVNPDQSRIFYHITPDTVVEVSGAGQNMVLRDFADLRELFARMNEVFSIPMAQDAGFEFAIDKNTLTEIKNLIASNRAAAATELLSRGGLPRNNAEVFVDTHVSPIKTLNIAAINNRKRITKTLDVIVSSGCNLFMEPCEQGLVKVSSFDFDKLIKKITFAV
jgi:hypothetical protein